jgi:F-type H+-transporting ATPase subunit gamma
VAEIRLIRRRIQSVKNIAKITKAMEMVATSKMRRAQERGLAGRPYSEKIRQVIADLAALRQTDEVLHPLLHRRIPGKTIMVHITPDRGLCGGLNTSINRSAANFILGQTSKPSLVCVGRKGTDFMKRTGQEVKAVFTGLGDYPSFLDTLPISKIVIDEYTSGNVDAVYLSYTKFVSTMVQKPVVQPLLPVEPAAVPQSQNVDYIYEPDPATVLSGLLPRFVEMEVYHAILEAIASEQSARMVAMRSATDNAQGLVDDLTLEYNKARQESITKELLDIAGGVAALAD